MSSNPLRARTGRRAPMFRALPLRLLAAILVAGAVTHTSNALAENLELIATGDTFTAPWRPDKNYNGANYFRVRDDGEKTGFLQFDPSQLDGEIESAVLNIVVKSVTSGGSIEVYEVLEDWGEMTVTYNNRPDFGAPVAGAAVQGSDVGELIQLDIKNLVQQWSNAPGTAHGLAVVGTDGVDATFRVRETGDAAFIDVVQDASGSGGPSDPPDDPPDPPADGTEMLYFSTYGNTSIVGVPAPNDDADIYRFNPVTGATTRIFDARNAGLPANADIDALYVIDPATFYISFNRNGGTQVPGLGQVMDEDVVMYHGGEFSWFLKGSDVGLGDDGNGEDIAGLHVLSDSSVLISTAGAAHVAGVSGARPHDVLRCDGSFGATANCTWSMFFDGSDIGLGGPAEKLDAVFVLDGDLVFSTAGNFSASGSSGGNNDLSRCENTQSDGCSAIGGFFDGNAEGVSDDVDAAHYVTNAFHDSDPDEFRVIVLGSSTAHGTGASPSSRSWVSLFDNWLGTVTARHEVINLAKSGLTTVEFRPDGADATDPNRNITRMLELKPDLIVINLPSNNVSEGIPVNTTIAHYHEMVDAADAAGVPLFLTTTQPRNLDDLSERAQLQDEAIAVRSEFGARVIDIYDEMVDYDNSLGLKAEYDSGDGTHPNNAGHQYIFETVRDTVSSAVTP